MSIESVEPGHCRNCQAALLGPYCAACGQRALEWPPTVRDAIHEAAGEVVNVDGKVFRTLRLLATRPGVLTREMFDGRYASYVRPLRLYLVTSIAALGVTGLMPNQGQADHLFIELLPPFMFVMVPAFALLVMLVMRRGGHTYPQHLDFALHLHTVAFALIALTAPLDLAPGSSVRGFAALLRAGLTVVYGVLALRTAYGVGWGTAVMRSAVILVAYVALMIAVITATLVIVLGATFSVQ